MNKPQIYLNDWLHIHPYNVVQYSDNYFVKLANKLYKTCILNELSDFFRKKLSLYLAAYLEDQISELGLWKGFISEHERLYGNILPFYSTGNDYIKDEVNKEDIAFIIWNTWQKAADIHNHTYVSPNASSILKQAELFYTILEEAYEEAPANEILTGYFDSFRNEEEANQKLKWLFGHTYLTEPSMLPYIDRVTPSDRFIIPTGPLALFLHEWITLLTSSTQWQQIEGLYIPETEIPETLLQKNKETYHNFTTGTNGKTIVYLNGYDELRNFLVGVLKWQDDDNHTLPQMKEHRNFILMTKAEKGILLAKDICEFIASPDNPLYNQKEAQKHAFRLLTEEMLCPPDLLTFCINNKLIPDAQIPETGEKELVQCNADFIARHSLLYYYRGD